MMPYDDDRCARRGCTQCFYCEMPLAFRHEHDHFPVPANAGGSETVATCMNCHELKDRTPFRHHVAFGNGIAELVFVCGVTSDDPYQIVSQVGDYRQHWRQLSPIGRIVYAKLRFLVESDKKLNPATLF